MELQEGIKAGWGRGDVAGFLIGTKVKDVELAAWLRRRGEEWLITDLATHLTDETPNPNLPQNSAIASLQELARRLVLLSGLRSGELGEVAGDIGRRILVKFPPPPPPEEDWQGKVIEAVFIGDGLGGGTNHKDTEDTEGNEEVDRDAEAWLKQGNDQYERGEFEEAIASYDKAIEFKPDNHEAWYGRGIAIRQLSHPYNPLSPKILLRFPASPPVTPNPILNQTYGYDGQILTLEIGLQNFQQDTREHQLGRGLLHQAIGNAHYFQGRRQETRRFSGFCQKAIASYARALENLTQDAFPEEHLDVLQDYIKALLSLRLKDDATELKRKATDLLRRLLNDPKRPESSKEKLTFKLASLQQLTVDIAVQSRQFIKALATAEHSKNACLSWLLYALPISPDQEETNGSETYTEIQQLLNATTAAVYWHLSPYALHTFIIKSGELAPIVIDLETDSLSRLEKFEAWVTEWNQQYTDYQNKEKDEAGRAQHPWRTGITDKLTQLKQILNIPAIEQELEGISHLILIPHRDLHRFPIHALLSDGFTITYLPSVQIGINLLNRSKPLPVNSQTLLSLENPHSTVNDAGIAKRLVPLPAADIESETICQLFDNPTRLGENDASLERVKTALQQPHSIFHFTGHGLYDFSNPLNSALYLSGSDRLTVREILNLDLSGYQLVCLSACETALTGNQTITAEYVGLVSAFMRAGAKYVLSTLWPVQSAASAVFAIVFYQQLQAGHSELDALSVTQKWLRDATREDLAAWYQAEIDKSTRASVRRFFQSSQEAIATMELDRPYQNPYYWAGFTLTGL